ncbi:MAG: hypothetical protein AVO35_10910 [Candidatus Aegiribacteria sp. MLS_C]|nr:MAG: hypothetical protein AVO35_10910 [Candidatus Aegiribacteria sp. MLS_C]
MKAGAAAPPGLFATDMDGTMLLPGMDFHELDLLALEELGRMGFIRVVATGRSPFSFMRMLDGRRLPVDFLVLSSGACIIDSSTGEYLRTSSMDGDSTSRLVDLLMEEGYDFCVQDTIPSNHVFRYCYQSGSNPDLERRLRLYDGYCRPLTEREEGKPCSQLVVVVPPGRDEASLVAGFSRILGDSCSVVRSTSPLDGESLWIELFPPEVSKSRGVMWVAERHGISRENVAAVGNDYNDHDLLEWAGSAYVVEDSPEHLRTSFTEVTSVYRGAVAHAARLWLTERGQLAPGARWPAS